MKKRNFFLAIVFVLPVMLFFTACTNELHEERVSLNLETAKSIQLINAELKPSFVESLAAFHAQGELQKEKDIELYVDRSIDKLFLKGDFVGQVNVVDNRLAVDAAAVHVGEDTYAYLMGKFKKQENDEFTALSKIEDCPGCVSFIECICVGTTCTYYLRCVPADQGPGAGPSGGPGLPGGGGECGLYTCDDLGEIKTFCLSGPVSGTGGNIPPCPPNICN